MHKPKIWLAGYGNSNTVAALLARAIDLDAIVIDVRLRPFSTRTGWSGSDLRQTLGKHRYGTYGQWWGNSAYKGGGIEIVDFDKGLEMLGKLCFQIEKRAGKAPAGVILLCSCRAEIGCHRGYLGKLLSQRDYVVRSLVWRPAP